MSWAEELIDLYEKNSAKAGIVQYKKILGAKGKEEMIPYVLLPPFHTTVTAQIQVTLDKEGNFLSAEKVEEEDKLTIIPVTEKSGSRTAGKAPHPLCDNLKYLSGEYHRYVKGENEEHPSCYEMYLEELKRWIGSEFTHDKATAIYRYIERGTILQDLIRENVLKLDQEGYLSEETKIEGIAQQKAFVRFVVRGTGKEVRKESCDECWKDRTLQNAFVQYYHSSGQVEELDYLLGQYQTISYLHSKKIRNEGDGAKLISSNDETNFTFRGRFATKEEALQIGLESSQKMHNALKWIIRRQGKSFDTLMMVTWESDLKQMPPWEADTDTIGETTKEEGVEGDFQDSVWEEEEEEATDGNPITAGQFFSALEGYRKQVNHTSRMILMAFDAATTGRLSLAEYKTLETTRYLGNIRKWHERCAWHQWKTKRGLRRYYYGVPGIREIADILYGSESNGRLKIAGDSDKKLYAEVSKRLLPCIWDGRNIPVDLVMRAIQRASTPLGFQEKYNWEKAVTLACSLVRKSRCERNEKEEWSVALKEECNNRDYLYGRLLAIADRIEYRTYDKEKDGKRVTNARRYMSTFAQRPFETWKVIEENLQPYLNKLEWKDRQYFESLLDAVFSRFEMDDFQKNSRLDGLYLLGFHSQAHELKRYKKEEE
ncbi:type I-C CRISPR-associated protein Cas8c/Csd1 [Suipraeoptans intestinalis]|uniref:type I-C CRISPR-associated protein Cas8c/Csd1 n=1 Tax=Suipraeoptans intestinalis TaxID=2606628 RepID=UPI002A760DA7|nr:type I-C CRISPR-associated protein Cas8c/Csd1 [Suipraeoptans intestinalis]MDY3121082.1 type I-C CRISPR-associated protein Cas8c/Csd1 [Suipraeoptans intestinalis]